MHARGGGLGFVHACERSASVPRFMGLARMRRVWHWRPFLRTCASHVGRLGHEIGVGCHNHVTRKVQFKLHQISCYLLIMLFVLTLNSKTT